MLSKKDAVVLTLMGLAQFYRKKYAQPGQKKIVKLCWKIHKVKMSIRTLNRYLRLLEDSGLIKRTRRLSKRHFIEGKFVKNVYGNTALRPTPKNPTDGRFKTTIYNFTAKCYNYVYKFTKKLEKLWKFFSYPKWTEGTVEAKPIQVSPSINRVPKMANYNTLPREFVVDPGLGESSLTSVPWLKGRSSLLLKPQGS